MPKSRKISCPARAKLASTMKQVSAFAGHSPAADPVGANSDGQKRSDGGEGVDQEEDGTEREHREAHDGRGANLVQGDLGWICPEHN